MRIKFHFDVGKDIFQVPKRQNINHPIRFKTYFGTAYEQHSDRGTTGAAARLFYSMLARAMMLRVSQKRVHFVQTQVLSHTPVQLLPLSARLHLCTLQLLQNLVESFLKMLFWGTAISWSLLHHLVVGNLTMMAACRWAAAFLKGLPDCLLAGLVVLASWRLDSAGVLFFLFHGNFCDLFLTFGRILVLLSLISWR